jgi:hypothetical protein
MKTNFLQTKSHNWRTLICSNLWLSALLLLVAMGVHAQPFTPGNLVVVRVGDGTAALSANGAAVFLEERATGGTLAGPILAVPNLVVSGSATSEGALCLSGNGLFLTIAGYNAPAGTASLPTSPSASFARVIGMVDVNRNFNVAAGTSSLYSGNNIRSGVTDGLNNFWGAGSGGGTVYFGNNAAPATVQNVILNTRVIQNFFGALFFSTGSGTPGIWIIPGTPITPATASPFIPTGTGASPYNFAFNPAQTTVYVADDRTIATGGGIQKWNFSGGIWTLAYTLGTASTVGARGLAVDFCGAVPVIYATTAEAAGTPNRLIRIVDTGAGSTATTIAVAAANTVYRGLEFAPKVPAPPLVLTVPGNITVPATIPGGAVVGYTVSATGGCSSPTVSAVPTSGSLFPVGTTIVNVTASDTCCNSTNKSFTVTVTALPTPQVPEYFSKSNNLPPTNGMYVNPFSGTLAYGSLRVRNAIHRGFSPSYAPPALGSSQLETFSSKVDFDLSTDGGLNFNPVSATANMTVNVTHSQDANGYSFYTNEMLHLDLTGPGFMLRESPTLASTGQTTTRPISAGFMISSFFDIFTEASTDNGLSWTPASGSHHVELRNDPRSVTGIPEPTPLLPPPNDKYVSPDQWHALYAQGIVIKDVSHKLFTTSMPSPNSGGTNHELFNSTVDLQVSTDGGNTFQSVRASAPVQITVANHGAAGSAIFDTEMTGLSISLPSGVMIRESPTEPSRGGTEIDSLV